MAALANQTVREELGCAGMPLAYARARRESQANIRRVYDRADQEP